MEIQKPVLNSVQQHESDYISSVKQSQIASVEIGGINTVDQSPKVPVGSVVPAVEALHWSVDQKNCDVRPRLTDKSTGIQRLLDSGSQISTTSRLPGDVEDNSCNLIAVNGSRIKTYGSRDIVFKINRKTYRMPAIVCDVNQDILGMDFFHKYKMGLEWDDFDQSELYLTDKRANIKS